MFFVGNYSCIWWIFQKFHTDNGSKKESFNGLEPLMKWFSKFRDIEHQYEWKKKLKDSLLSYYFSHFINITIKFHTIMILIQYFTMTLEVISFQRSLETKLEEIWKNQWCVSDIKIIQTSRKSNYFTFIMFDTLKLSGFSSSLDNFNVRHKLLIFPYLL